MDFFQVRERVIKDVIEIYPDFLFAKSKDLMVRGKAFYAVWDEAKGLWSTDEYDLRRLIDKEIHDYRDDLFAKAGGSMDKRVRECTMFSFDTGIATKYKKFLASLPDNAHQLDNKIIFRNTVVKKTDYASRRLSYDIAPGSIEAYDKLIGTLYSPVERMKLEWAIGSIIAGDSRYIQKFIVLYGDSGSGKSTFLNILQSLFEGYYTMFEAKALGSGTNMFSTEAFRSNPLVAIQHDGDLSRIEDNSKLNSIISHEEMIVNEKYKQSYAMRFNCFLFIGTNRPVKVTDAKSGIIRRLIDVRPTGNRLEINVYNTLVENIKFELGAIANHCLKVYLELGKNYYNGYRPQDMILQTNVFYNFISENYFTFKRQDMTTLSQAYELYKSYCDTALVSFKLPRHVFREELKSYFSKYVPMTTVSGKPTRDVYRGFLVEKMDLSTEEIKLSGVEHYVLDMIYNKSIFDQEYGTYSAQYATEDGIPQAKWETVTTKLKDLDTRKLHYVRLPDNHIVIDFDLKNENGDKSLERNLREASYFPRTYAEYSKSGLGVHLHYIYNGDVKQLARLYAPDIEVKVFTGNSALRRKLTLCNGEPINHISGGLPLKEEKAVLQASTIQSEHGLRKLIERNLNKEIHSSTKSSIDFIYKILEDAYASSLVYDVRDMQHKVIQLAMQSTNHKDYCTKVVYKMKFVSDMYGISEDDIAREDEIVFFDVEVFPNLFVVCYKIEGDDKDVVKMINPTPEEVEHLFEFKLVGFNNRRYDNHILYARHLGYTNEQLFNLSQKIIASDDGKSGTFGEAYNISYTDVYDFSSVKQSLKKWEIDLGIDHVELGYEWDKPVSEDKWNAVAEYCANDVIATEMVFRDREADWTTRKILADLADGSVNDTTNQLSTRIIFGDDKHPQLVYTDLATGEQY